MLAAIMFTDMVGYTALMGSDEAEARSRRDRQRRVLEETIGAHGGRVVQYFGDGTLSVFGSAVEAVTCAVEVQRELRAAPAVPLRIGLHVGDIVYEDEGIVGDGVNVASRIESLAVPGAVLISDKVCDELHNHPTLTTTSLGLFELKNVRRPIEIHALSCEGLVVPRPEDLYSDKGALARRSIAVLPFVNMSADPENEYFSDGITEELINALTRVHGLQVTSRTSSFAFKNRSLDVREIGQQLGVATVLEGSVRKVGDTVRVSAQLINTADGYHYWSEVYDRRLENIFEIQDEISHRIAGKLIRQFAARADRTQPLVKNHTSNTEAYNLYLKGRALKNRWDPKEAMKAVKLFRQAIELDPEYALPYSSAAACCSFAGATGWAPPEIAYPDAEQYALKALELDDTVADSHLALATVRLFYYWDFEGARLAIERAIEINPGFAEAYLVYDLYLSAVGRTEEAVAALEKAHELDPLSPMISLALGAAYGRAGRFIDGEQMLLEILERDPSDRNARNQLGVLYSEAGDYEKALPLFEESYRQVGDELRGFTHLAAAYGLTGWHDEARALLEKLHRRAELEGDADLTVDFAIIHTALGEHDTALDYLEQACAKRLGSMVFLNRDFIWDPLRKEPRFRALVEKVGLSVEH